MNAVMQVPGIPSFINYWDELLFLLLFVVFALKNIRTLYISRENLAFIVPWICLIAVGLIGNFLYRYAYSMEAISRDIIGILKFPIGFFLIREIGFDSRVANAIRKNKLFIIKLLVIIMFLLGVISIFTDLGMSYFDVRYGLKPFLFVFTHPTILVTFSVFILLIITVSEKTNEYLLYEIMLIVVITLAFRTKGIAFIIIYLVMKYCFNLKKEFKIKFVYWLIPLVLACVVGYEKVVLLKTWTGSARTVLTLGSFELFSSCFPIGSGFATYASHISGEYRSLVYDFIYSTEFFDSVTREPSPNLGDVGFPYYIGQFGLVGMILIVISIKRIFSIWKNKGWPKGGFAENMIMIYFAVTLTTEALLVNNGMECALVLAVIISIDSNKSKNVNVP